MLMKRTCLVFCVAILVSVSIFTQSFAEELKVGFSFAKPPFIFAKRPFEKRFYDVNNEGLGLEIDIFKAALTVKGSHTLKPVYMPYDQLTYELNDGKIDAAATVRAELAERFYSEEFVYFHNFAITKSEKNISITGLNDLKGKSIVAWQGAKFDLGKSFENVVKDNPKYIEKADQKIQVGMFLNDRVEVLVIDQNIFKWWQKVLTEPDDTPAPVTYHDLFPEKTGFLVGFLSEKIRDDFNEGLAQIKQDGTYDKIISGYVD